jgi:hypothetical protein
MMWLLAFGVLFSVILGCPRLCLDMLICLIVGSPLASQGVLWCEKWCLCSFFDVYGRKEMIETLTTRRGTGHQGKFYLCFTKHCIFRQRHLCPLPPSRNDRNFDDWERERTLGEILSLFYETLYLLIGTFVSPPSHTRGNFIFVLRNIVCLDSNICVPSPPSLKK